MKEAMFYEKLEGSTVRCHLCPHLCKINESRRGICGVRENRNGILYTLVYGKVVARAIDPIEKKPLFHFYPYLDAVNVDLKGLSEELYLKNCGGHLQPVLDAIKLYKRLGVLVEVTTPGYTNVE